MLLIIIKTKIKIEKKTSVLRAATDRRPSKISRLKIETAVSRSNLFLKITKLISIPYNKKMSLFFYIFNFNSFVFIPKIRFLPH